MASKIVKIAGVEVGGTNPLTLIAGPCVIESEALVLATACFQATHMVGMPEASLMLSETCLYLALAPKSNSALTAYTAAKEDVLERPNEPVPLQLRIASTGLAKTM